MKGYDGPERPLAEVSIVRAPDFAFDYSRRAPLNKIDDREMDRFGVLVLPGEHQIRLSFLRKEQAGECVTRQVPDWSRYWECIDRQDVSQGVCGMYLNSAETTDCPATVADYSCTGVLQTAAGREYVLVITDTTLGVIEAGTMRGSMSVGRCLVGTTTTIIDHEQRRYAPRL